MTDEQTSDWAYKIICCLGVSTSNSDINVVGLHKTVKELYEQGRDDERAKCAADYLQDCCDAVDAARLEEREACVKLLDDFAKTEMAPVKDTWRMGVMAAANAVRDKK